MDNADIGLGRKVSGNAAYRTKTRLPLSTGHGAQSKDIHGHHFPELGFCVESALGDAVIK